MEKFILKYKYLIAFGIFVTHYIFKTYALGATGFWFDECYSVYVGGSCMDEILKSTQTTDPNPPLYLMLLHYWMLVFGDSEFGVRLFSVVASSLSASLLFLFCIRFLNWQAAIFASIMFFTSNDLYYYAQEARTFSILILFIMLSNYFYLSIYKTPKIWQPFLLGLCNATIFYLHLIATFNTVAQVVCLPFMLISFKNQNNVEDKYSFSFFRLSISKKVLIYYLISFLVFTIAILPWIGRLANIMTHEGTTFWISNPRYADFKYCIYELFNSKELYQVYIISFVILLILFLLFKKLRQEKVKKRIFLFIIISGPLLIYTVYLAASYSPFFLKRYVLFTFIGFILLYAYTFSLIKVNFYFKLILFFILGVFTFQQVIFPRASFFEYDKAMVFFKKIQKPDTFISTNMPDLFSYYYDKKIFHLRPDSVKKDSLLAKGICAVNSFDSDWIEKQNTSKYKHIFYTSSFNMYDSENFLGKLLEQKFILTNEIRCFKGICIRHYYNPPLQSIYIQSANGKYMFTGDNKVLMADKVKSDSLEKYGVIKLKNNICIFATSKKLYLSARIDHPDEIVTTAKWMQAWEKFKLIQLEGGFVAFKAFNEKYLSVDEKSQQVFVNGLSIGENEKFKIINVVE